MIGERLADLDELVLRCRDAQAKAYIAEAAACYRAGAFRSCIVATWVAVVFDFLHKLRELDLAGDKNARTKLANFDAIRQQGDKRRLLEFERAVLDMAKTEFELISPLEYDDLVRLHDDRNRCAHPSMNSEDEIYQPTAELARYHLRTAVTSLLQHQPVQGKAASERLIQEVGSDYFPLLDIDALEHFRHGPLSRPRPALVRTFADALVKHLLYEDLDGVAPLQHAAALNAVREMHPDVTAEFLSGKLSNIARSVPDLGLIKLLRFLALVPDTWDLLSEDVQRRVERYVWALPEHHLSEGLGLAARIAPLSARAMQKMNALNTQELATIIRDNPSYAPIDRAIDLYAQSANFNQANLLGASLIEPLIGYMNLTEMEKLLSAARENDQIIGSFRWSRIEAAIWQSSTIPAAELNKSLARYGLGPKPEDIDIDDLPF